MMPVAGANGRSAAGVPSRSTPMSSLFCRSIRADAVTARDSSAFWLLVM